MRVAIVGCGLIGSRRARVAAEAGDDVAVVADVDAGRAEALAAEVGARATDSWQDALAEDGLDVVVAATPNAFLLPIGLEALAGGRHLLCEKPLGRNAEEAGRLVAAAQEAGRVLKVGFNHRHKQAVARAHELLAEGAIGDAFAVRAAYGHGGRPGYEAEWRGDASLSGGGELLDQGVHVVDLCRWFLGEPAAVSGMLATWHWPVSPLEDNAFALLRTEDGRIASLHTSWTQWRNLFRFEVLGTDGYLAIDGLGGSYGEERLRLGRRRAEGGRPDEQEWTFPDEDPSWRLEWRELRTALAEGRQPLGSGVDGYRAALVLDAIYEAARTGGTAAVPAP